MEELERAVIHVDGSALSSALAHHSEAEVLRFAYVQYVTQVEPSQHAQDAAERYLIQLLSRDAHWMSPQCLSKDGAFSALLEVLSESAEVFPWTAYAVMTSLLNISLHLSTIGAESFPEFSTLLQCLLSSLSTCICKADEHQRQRLCRYMQTVCIPTCHHMVKVSCRMLASILAFTASLVTALVSFLCICTAASAADASGLQCLLDCYRVLCTLKSKSASYEDLTRVAFDSVMLESTISSYWYTWTRGAIGEDCESARPNEVRQSVSVGSICQHFLLSWMVTFTKPGPNPMEQLVPICCHAIIGCFRQRLALSVSDLILKHMDTLLGVGLSIKSARKKTNQKSALLKYQIDQLEAYLDLGIEFNVSALIGIRGRKSRFGVGDIDTMLLFLLFPLSGDGFDCDCIVAASVAAVETTHDEWLRYISTDGMNYGRDMNYLYDKWATCLLLATSFSSHLQKNSLIVNVAVRIGDQLLNMQDIVKTQLDSNRCEPTLLWMLLQAYQRLLQAFAYAVAHAVPKVVMSGKVWHNSSDWMKLKSIVASVFNDFEDCFSASGTCDLLEPVAIWLSLAPIYVIPRPLLSYLIFYIFPHTFTSTDGIINKHIYKMRRINRGCEFKIEDLYLNTAEHLAMQDGDIPYRLRSIRLYTCFLPVGSLVSWHAEKDKSWHALFPNVHAMSEKEWKAVQQVLFSRMLSALRNDVPSVSALDLKKPERLTSSAVKCFQSRDIFNTIISFLTAKRLYRLANVNKTFREHCEFLPMWRDRYYSRWVCHNVRFESQAALSSVHKTGCQYVARHAAVTCRNCLSRHHRTSCSTSADMHDWKYLYMRREIAHRQKRGVVCPYIGCEVILSTNARQERHEAVHARRVNKYLSLAGGGGG